MIALQHSAITRSVNGRYPMAKPTLNGKLALVAVFFLFASSFALFWLVSTFAGPYDSLSRVGFLCAVLCALGALVLAWSFSFAYLARVRNWSALTCLKAGLPLGAVGILLFIIEHVAGRGLAGIGTLLASNSILAGFIVRRLVYPGLTDEEAASQKPLTLFPK
jgi:hypothetical protein